MEKELLNTLDLSALEGLSEAQRQAALQILQEYAESGSSKAYENLLLEDYAEVPVDIDTFLHDPNYLGKGLVDDDGRFTVFPYWVEVLHKLFPDNINTAYNTLILSGAIGLGKSFIAVIAMLYLLYRMLCLKDPYKHFGLQPIDHITFSLMNITLGAAKGVAWSKIQELLQLSPWFMAHGRLSKGINPEWQPTQNIELIYGSQPRHVIGRAVYCSFEDEISFIPTQDVNKQKEKAKTLISSIDARMSSRFMKGESLPTLHILASSKRTDQSFLETYIETKKKNESKTTLIIDEPQWVIRTDKDSPNKFAVAVGNKFLDSEVLPLDADENDFRLYRDKGYSILMVPMGYYEQFLDDINIALTDIAGISTSSSTNYINGPRWTACRDPGIKNPFTKEILVVGNAPDDTTQYADFFDMSCVPQDLINRPLFIHLDMSISGDKTGIAGIWIRGKADHVTEQAQSKELFYQLAFSVAIKAPKGRQVSFEKNRQFIYWLREQGFNIKGISYDTFNSVDLGQSLQAQGFPCSVISVDRVTSLPGDTHSRVCIPYQTLRNVINEKRIKTYKTDLLTAEIVGLVRDGNGKIDHTTAGINSKDIADALCLSGDTKIYLLSGKHKTIEQLYLDRDHLNEWVLSYNVEKNDIEPVLIKDVVCNGYRDDLIRLYLDNGETLTCTKDHKLLTRNGEYVEAQDSLDVSLMPFNYENRVMFKDRDYPYIYLPQEDGSNKGVWLHKLVGEHLKSSEKQAALMRRRPGEWVVLHHKNCDRQDNNPESLEYLTNTEHSYVHTQMNTSAKKREQISLANKKALEAGTHPFQRVSREQRRLNGCNSLTKLNKTEAHKFAVSNNNKKLAAEGRLSLQLKRANAHTYEANSKRDATCLERYNGTGFKSTIIQRKCRESCQANNGYDNPRHSRLKQREMLLSKLRKGYEIVLETFGLNPNEPMTLLDFKIYCYRLNLSGVSTKIPDIQEARLPIDCSNFDSKVYESLRNKGNCVRLFLKDTGKDKFIYSEFSDYYDKQCSVYIKAKGAGNFRYRFKEKPTYEDLIRLGFNVCNHRVVKIAPADPSYVYDLKLDKIHNFAINAGLFVHNCGSIFNASQHAEEFAYDYGESSEQLLRLNESSNTEADLRQLTVSLEEELKAMGRSRMGLLTPPDLNLTVSDDYAAYNEIIIL